MRPGYESSGMRICLCLTWARGSPHTSRVPLYQSIHQSLDAFLHGE